MEGLTGGDLVQLAGHYDGDRDVVAEKLKRKIEPVNLRKREGPAKRKLVYASTEKMIETANEIFGYDGWNNETKRMEVIEKKLDGKSYKVVWMSIVRVTLKSGVYREGTGTGLGQGEMQAAHEKAMKEAESDALKRALKNFGPALGLCLYDKDYLRQIESKVKMG